MGAPFSDITLYIPTKHAASTREYAEETSLHNFVSDLYVTKMNGYKPPNTTRVCIQPGFYNIWDRTWKNGSLISIAPEFRQEEYYALDKHGKYRYLLDLIQGSMIQLSEEYKWDKLVFEKAYNDVIESCFTFKIHYPAKMSKDQKKTANLCMEKTETETFVYAEILTGIALTKIKLFEKKNDWWYDCAYKLVRYAKWFDADRFGVSFEKEKINIWYSIQENKVSMFENGNDVKQVNFDRFFNFC